MSCVLMVSFVSSFFFFQKSSGSVYPKRCCFLDDIFSAGSHRFEKGDAIGWLDRPDKDVLAFSQAVSEVDTSMLLYWFSSYLYHVNSVVKLLNDGRMHYVVKLLNDGRMHSHARTGMFLCT